MTFLYCYRNFDYHSYLVHRQMACYLQSQNQSYVTTDGQSAGFSWCQAPIWGQTPDFCYCQTIAGFLMWDVLSDERMGLTFTNDAGPRQRSHSRIRVPRDSWPHFTVSDSRLPTWRARSPYLYPPVTGWPSYIPRHWTSLSELNAVGLVIYPRSGSTENAACNTSSVVE
jgi:hypothetical protein